LPGAARVTLARGLLAALLLVLCGAIAMLEPGRSIDLAWLKAEQATLQDYVARHPFGASALCFIGYTAATALSVPGAIVMTLAAGAVFGVVWGTVIVSFACAIGASLAFLMSRYLFRAWVHARFGHRLAAIDRGMEADGPRYLLTLRLIPVVSFVLVNLLMALTPIPLRSFYLYSQLGMLPVLIVYVNAGTRLAQLEHPSDILSGPLLLSFALLAALPFAARAVATLLRRRAPRYAGSATEDTAGSGQRNL
jgi:uncharacterized membrane protein YdjX (TVP38/TMEM64 family)